jgi:putative nucleotidyltransferase with HDIG domain
MNTQVEKRAKLIQIYTTLIAVLGLLIILIALTSLPTDLLGFLVVASLAALAELTSVELFISSRQSRVSISSIIAIASILLFGPLAGVLTHMTSGLMTIITTTFLSKLPEKGRVSWLNRVAFNSGMWAISAAVAGWVYVVLGGTPGTVNQTTNLIPLIGAVTVDTLLNLGILIGVITLQTGKTPFYIWKQNFQWAAPIAIIGGVLGGGALALAYEMFSFLGIVVFLVPVLATSYSFRLYTNNMRGYVDQLEELNLNLEKTNLGLLETMGAIIDAYDIYTYGHSTQVAHYAAAICEQMELPELRQATIVRAALVHDIGKVGVTDRIVGKPDKLTQEERNIMKRHPRIGAEILERMEGFQDIVPLVRYHHERWDGCGYPDGIKGEEIPLGARILSVADTLDAMLSDRPYRPTRSLHYVLAEINRCSGGQFDPQVVEALLKLAKEKDRNFFKNSAATVDQTLRLNNSLDISSEIKYLKKSMIPTDSN